MLSVMLFVSSGLRHPDGSRIPAFDPHLSRWNLSARRSITGGEANERRMNALDSPILRNTRRAPSPSVGGVHSANSAGFTLIEIMMVVIVIGVLAALVLPRIMDRPDEARRIAARQDIATISQALKMYKLDNYRYPTTEQGLKALMERPTVSPIPKNWKEGGYLEFTPMDPWGNEYVYLHPGKHGEIDLYSRGADGQDGGEGMDADISRERK